MKWSEIWGRIMPRRIIIYADFIDPFCYIGFHNVRRLARAEKIPMEWRGFELNPDTPKEGSLLQTAFNSDLRPGMWASVRDFAKKSGLVLQEPTFVPNTALAHAWVGSVEKQDVKYSLIERIYQAYLSEKKDIGKVEILLELADEFELRREPLKHLAATRDRSLLEQFRRQAMDYQFTGMPGFVCRGKTYFGALSEDAWRMILKETLCSTR